jgi:antitoxin component of MazEF toxin-antitoxin module
MEAEQGIVIEWPRTIRIHGGALYISLPSDWIRSNNIRPGKNIRLQLLNDGSLKIKPEVIQ